MAGPNPYGFPVIPTDDVQARLRAELPSRIAIPLANIIRSGERILKQTFGILFPAVYILKQNFQSTGSGGASNPVLRQTYDNYIEIACVAGKYVDGSAEGETARVELCGAVYDVLHGWQVPNMALAFDLFGYSDGDPADSVNYGVLRFHTRKLTQRTVS